MSTPDSPRAPLDALTADGAALMIPPEMPAKRKATPRRRGQARAKNYPKGSELVDVFSRILDREAADFDRLLEMDSNRPSRSMKIAALIRDFIAENRDKLGRG